MDIGDWQELSRVRGENHAWHRCVDGILEAVRAPRATNASIRDAVEQNVTVLNQHLEALHRRTVQLHAR
jgi:hypothetical protein